MRKLSATTFRIRLGKTLDEIKFRHERIIIERNGRPAAAIISIDDLRLLEALEDRLDIEEAVEILEDGYGNHGRYSGAPRNNADAKDNYGLLLRVLGDLCANHIAARAAEADEEGVQSVGQIRALARRIRSFAAGDDVSCGGDGRMRGCHSEAALLVLSSAPIKGGSPNRLPWRQQPGHTGGRARASGAWHSLPTRFHQQLWGRPGQLAGGSIGERRADCVIHRSPHWAALRLAVE